MNQDVPELNKQKLHNESVYTDLEQGAIKVYSPCDVNGVVDETLEKTFIAITSIMTPNGPMQINAPIADVKTLKDAIDKFGEAVNTHIEKMIEEAKRIQNEQRIITPDQIRNRDIQIIK